MKGTTLECLEHYLKTLPWGTNRCGEEKKPLVEFVGITTGSVRRWLTKESIPKGMRLVKLRYFLESKGYEVTELAKIQEPIKSLGRLIAFGKIDIREVSLKVGYPGIDELFQVLHGNHGVPLAKKKALELICEKFEETIPKQPIGVIEIIEEKKFEKLPLDADSRELLGFLNCIDALYDLLEPRLEEFLSDNVSSEKRQEFRQKAGRKLVFDLANRCHSITSMLNSLCSEKSREINKKKDKEKKGEIQ
jgi:hypothetical protein